MADLATCLRLQHRLGVRPERERRRADAAVEGGGEGLEGVEQQLQRRVHETPAFRVQDSGFRVQGSGFRVQGSGFRVQGSGFRRFSQVTGRRVAALVVGAIVQPLNPNRCRANMAQIRQSRPHSGLGFRVEVLKTFYVVP